MENYFWNTEQNTHSKKVYVLVIYDIVDNKRRNRFAKELQGYGFRVQKSAFEAIITENLYQKLISVIPGLINNAEDNVRVYRIVGSGEVRLFGVSQNIQNEEIIII